MSLFRRIRMAKKKPTSKKKATRRKPKEPPMSKGFGHLTIPDDARIKDTGIIHESDKDIDSLECWESYDWDDE